MINIFNGGKKNQQKNKTCKETNDTKTRTFLHHFEDLRLYSILFEAKPISHFLHSNGWRVIEITASTVSEKQS